MIALVTGANGQKGSYMCDLLLEKGYIVYGLVRRSVSSDLWRLSNSLKYKNFNLVEGDITDLSSLISIFQSKKPKEIYNFAAQSHVGTSFHQPKLTWDITAQGAMNVIEAVRLLELDAKIYQAGSSEMFGTEVEVSDTGFSFQQETTTFRPQSPYSIAKLAAHHTARLYRESYGMFICNGILFNNESPRRGINFVTRKITSYFYRYLRGEVNEPLKLGNLNACRDWGYSPEYCDAIYRMMQQPKSDDYVIATGETNTIYDFLHAVLELHGLHRDIPDLVVIDESLKRPAEVPFLRGKADKAHKILGWKSKTKFYDLVEIMVREENGKA